MITAGKCYAVWECEIDKHLFQATLGVTSFDPQTSTAIVPLSGKPEKNLLALQIFVFIKSCNSRLEKQK
jgi:hypothetical protein